MVADREVFYILDQPPPVIVECMSRSEHFYGIESSLTWMGLWNLLHVYIA